MVNPDVGLESDLPNVSVPTVAETSSVAVVWHWPPPASVITAVAPLEVRHACRSS